MGLGFPLPFHGVRQEEGTDTQRRCIWRRGFAAEDQALASPAYSDAVAGLM